MKPHARVRRVLSHGGVIPACALLAVTACGDPGPAPQLTGGLSIDALAQTVWVEEFDVAPGGDLLTFKSAAAGTYDLWTVSVDGGEPTQLTSMPGREMRPIFSPDGRWIVFEADQGGSNARDLYIVPTAGGEPVRLTEHPLNDVNASWSADSQTIYFNTGQFFDNSIAAIDIRTRSVTRIGAGVSGTLSPDGSTFAYTGNTKPQDDDQSNLDVWTRGLDGGAPLLLTPNTFDSRDTEPEWSPDGTRLAFISDRNGFNNLGVIDLATGRATMLLTEDIEHSEPRWSPDGEWISFTKNLDYDYHIFRIPAAGGVAEQLTSSGGVNGGSHTADQTRGTHRWQPDGTRIIYTHSDPSLTGDLWTISASGGNARQVTNHQHESLRDPDQFVWPEFIEYTGFEGLEVAGLVYRPKDAVAGEPRPGLFFYRANSNGQHPKQWQPYIQYFVSLGYVVFAPNFRGSTGRGKEYRQAVHTFGGDHDIEDAFIGMDMLIERGWVDPDRVGVFGGSTGGFFTVASILKDPDRFRAGVSWYGVTDLVTLSSYGGLEGWTRYLIGGTPLTNPQNYYDRSLVYHAADVEVPLLFLHAQGDGDARFQQIEMYGTQAEIHDNWYDWVLYGGEPHGWYYWRPDSVRQSLEIMDAMFARFIAGEDRDVHALAADQRRGVEFQRNPTIELWNALTNGVGRR